MANDRNHSKRQKTNKKTTIKNDKGVTSVASNISCAT